MVTGGQFGDPVPAHHHRVGDMQRNLRQMAADQRQPQRQRVTRMPRRTQRG